MPNRGNIPKKSRENNEIREKVRERILEALPDLTERCKRCDSTTQIENIYKDFKEIILKPWEKMRKTRPKRFKSFWTKDLDNLSKERSKIYRVAKRSGTQTDWSRYEETDRAIKKTVRKRKQNALKRTKASLNSIKNTDLSTWVSKKLRNNDAEQHQTRNLNPKDFTIHMGTKEEEGFTPEIKQFKNSPTLTKSISTAIKKAPKKKATGTDEVFTEALEIEPDLTAKFLGKLWERCGHTKKLIKDWETAEMVPIFKKGDDRDPRNYRPIALLSHARKFIEAGLSTEIRKVYSFDHTQLVFQTQTGTETAIIRHIAHAEKYPYTAILDRKSAYDSVPRQKLIQTLRERTPDWLVDIISLTLQDLTIKTLDEETKTKATIKSGVTQGSPLSPTVFNIYMDTFADAQRQRGNADKPEPNTTETTEAISAMFADEVKVQAT